MSVILDPGNLITHEHRLPAGVRSGDLILGAIEVYDDQPFSVPSGFSHVATAMAGNKYTPKTVVFRAWAYSGQARVAITFAGNTSKSSSVAVYRGVDRAGPIMDVSTAFNDGSPAITVGSVVAGARNRLVLFIGACSNSVPGFWTGTPAGMTRRAIGTAEWRGIVVYDQTVQAGATGSRTAVRDGPTHQSGILVALRVD